VLRSALVFVFLIIGGCDSGSKKILDFLADHDSNVVVLARQPIIISQEQTTLQSSEVMKVIGESTFVCFALKGGLPLQKASVMDTEFQTTMHGSRVKVVIELTTHDQISLDQPMMAWNMFGKILKSDELSACASTSCSTQLPVGAEVGKIYVSSEPSLAVQGVYWSSERGPLEKAAPLSTGNASGRPKAQSGCRMGG
jgi:hypothetical protein